MFLPPGMQARFYLQGLLAGAKRLGIETVPIELQALWARTRAGESLNPAGVRQARDWIGGLVKHRGITHTLGYATGAAMELGVGMADDRPRTYWHGRGVTNVQLWTDHPNWYESGSMLHPTAAALLEGPEFMHWLKSASAAEEAASILGWTDVRGLAMAEEPGLLEPPAAASDPDFDAVVICGSIRPIRPELESLLGDDQVETRQVLEATREAATAGWDKWLAELDAPSQLDLPGFGRAAIAMRCKQPAATVWEITNRPAFSAFEGEIRWLRSEPRRWYDAIRRIQRLAIGLRSFWPAWLARRAKVGVFGADASALGIEQTAEQKAWVSYARQSAVYRRGACGLNINQPHDEAGVTHKPFQIVASGVPCVHGATAGLGELFETGTGPGRELCAFESGPELLKAVRTAAADASARERIAAAARDRFDREHRWEHRLEAILRPATPTAEVVTSRSRTAA